VCTRVSWYPGEDRRSEARERALGLLYEAEVKGLDATEVLEALPARPDPLAESLVRGVHSHLVEIDALLTRFARGWSVSRMAMLDRAVLRVATFELLARPDVPTAVVIDEAVELAKGYGSTDESFSFVNGVLSSIAAEVRPESAQTKS
jgi:transcription antitermination protein NusB